MFYSLQLPESPAPAATHHPISMFRSLELPRIDTRGRAHLAARGLADLREMAADALLRSQGQCEAFCGEGTGVVDDNFLRFLAEQAPLLKRLILNSCREVTHKGFMEVIERFPLLEELEVSSYSGVHTREALKDIAILCPGLKHLRLIDSSYIICCCCPIPSDDREAMAIATMHELRSLQLVSDQSVYLDLLLSAARSYICFP